VHWVEPKLAAEINYLSLGSRSTQAGPFQVLALKRLSVD
jgi:hypothetical protein